MREEDLKILKNLCMPSADTSKHPLHNNLVEKKQLMEIFVKIICSSVNLYRIQGLRRSATSAT